VHGAIRNQKNAPCRRPGHPILLSLLADSSLQRSCRIRAAARYGVLPRVRALFEFGGAASGFLFASTFTFAGCWFGAQLFFGLQPIFAFVSGQTAAFLVKLKSALGDFIVGRFARDHRLLLDWEIVVFPGFKSAVHLHHLIAGFGEVQSGFRGEMTLLGVAINDIHGVLAQTAHALPFGLG